MARHKQQQRNHPLWVTEMTANNKKAKRLELFGSDILGSCVMADARERCFHPHAGGAHRYA